MPYFRDSTETYVKGYDATEVTFAGMTQHYWVLPAPTGQTAGELLHHDTRRNTFVYHASGGPHRIDSRDYYYQGTGATSYDTLAAP